MVGTPSPDMVTTLLQLVFEAVLQLLYIRNVFLAAFVVIWFLQWFASSGDNPSTSQDMTESGGQSTKTSSTWTAHGRRKGTVNQPNSQDPSLCGKYAWENKVNSKQGYFHGESESGELSMRFQFSENISGMQGEKLHATPIYTDENLQYAAKPTAETALLGHTKDTLTHKIESDTSRDNRNQTLREKKPSRDEGCHCKLTGKSASWGEADLHAQKRKRSNPDSDQPIAVHYYYGKLIQVASSKQVQIGNNCTMEVTDEGFMSDESGLCQECHKRYQAASTAELSDMVEGEDSASSSP